MNRPRHASRAGTDAGDSDAVALSATGKTSLIASIEADAHAEEAKILQDAADQATQREQYTNKKIESIFNEAHRKAAQQGQILHDKAVAQAELEIKRRRLRARNDIIGRIMSMAEEKLARTIGNDTYREVLIGWIVEAALGLNVPAAILNASAQERALIESSLLEEVQARVERSRGQSMTIKLADGPALASQGIILTAQNGRTAYNNQVKTRLLRQQREIQRLIHDALFAEEMEEGQGAQKAPGEQR